MPVTSLFDDAINVMFGGSNGPTKQEKVTATAPQKRAAVAQQTGHRIDPAYERAKRDAYLQAALEKARPDSVKKPTLAEMNTYDPYLPAKVAGRGDYLADKTASRTPLEAARDAVTGAGNALLVQTPLNIAAMVTSLGSDRVGTAIAGVAEDAGRYMQGRKSFGEQSHMRAYEAELEATREERIEETKQDIANGDTATMIGAKYIGREIWESIKRASDDPVVFGSGMADAVGSLFAAGPLGKAVGKIGSVAGKASRGLAVGANGPSKGYYQVTKAAQGLKVPAAIALMESGGTYSQTANAIMAMDHEQLMSSSEEYRSLIAQDFTPEDAKVQIAAEAAEAAAAVQAPLAAATGKLVSRFEGNPLAAVTPRQFMGNILREALEEGGQGATGQISSNAAIRSYADEDQLLAEGVGEQIGLGALYGAGAAGAVQAPGMAGRAARRVASKAWDASVGAVSEAYNEQRAKNEASSPISEARVREAATTLREAGPELRAEVEEAINNNPDATPEQKTTGLQYLDNLFETANHDGSGWDTDVFHPEVRDVMTTATDRYDVLQKLSDLINTSKDPVAVSEAGEELFHFLRIFEDRMTKDFTTALEAIPDDHPMLPKLRQMEDTLLSFAQTQKVKDGIENAQKAWKADLDRWAAEDAAETAAINPDTIRAATNLARTDPASVDPGLADRLLTEEGIELTPEQIIALKGVVQVARASTAAQTFGERLGLENVDAVSKQVLEDDDNSVIGHMRLVVGAMENGNTEAAQIYLSAFRDFAQHMQNKLGAVNASLATGRKTPFLARDLNSNEWFEQRNSYQVHPKNENSVRGAQQIAVEAGITADAVNGLIEMFPDLGVEKVSPTQLDEALNRKADEVVSNFSQPKADDKAEAQPKPEVVETEAAPAESNSDQTPVAEDPAQPKGGDQSTETDVTTEATPETAAPSSVEGGDTSTEVEQEYVDPYDTSQKEISDLNDDQLDTEIDNLMVEGESQGLDNDQRDRLNSLRDERDRRIGERQDAKQAEQEAKREAAEQVEQAPVEEPARAEPDPTPRADNSEPASTTEPAPATVKQRIGQKINGLVDWFDQAFKLPAIKRTNFREGVSPLALIREAVSNPAALRNLMRREPKHKLTDLMSESYTGYLKLADQIMANMQRRLKEELLDAKYQKTTFREALLSGDGNIQTSPRAKAVNIAVVDEDGNITYDQDLLEKTALAALQWALTAGDRVSQLDAEDAAKITGLPEEEAINYVEALTGMSPTEAASSMASTILRFWGMTKNPDMELGYSQGILEAVAKEALLAMEGVKIFSEGDQTLVTKVTLSDPINKKDVLKDENGNPVFDFPNTVVRWNPGRFLVEQKDGPPAPHPIKGFPNLIEEAAVKDPEYQTFIGEAPTRIARTQLRNDIPLARQQKQTIEVAQNEVHTVNVPMVNFLKAITREGAVRLFAEGDLTNRKLNINDRLTREGKNRTIGAAYEKLMATISEVENIGDLASTAIHYAYEISRANRLQMQGEHNPQASKVAREAILPTWATLDLAKNANHQVFFHLALAQALGIKIHEKSRRDSTKEVIKLLSQMPKSLELLSGDFDTLNSDAVDTLLTEMKQAKVPATPVAVHAMMEYARYRKLNDRSAFRTALYIEADGVTNGPVNAMMMLTAGAFTEQQIENAKKGGVFFDGTPSMNAHRQTEGGKTDMYGSVSNSLVEKLIGKLSNTDTTKGAGQQLLHLLNLIDALGLKIEIDADKGTLKIDRGVSKNPLTISIYGSGERGIAGNIATEILNALYGKFSLALEAGEGVSEEVAMFGDRANGDPELARHINSKAFDAINALLATKVVDNKGKMEKVFRKTPAKRGRNGLADYTYDRIDFRALQENILNLMVTPMRDSINETLGGDTLDNANILRKATQIQSIKLKTDFLAGVQEIIARKKANTNTKFKMSDFVSEDDMRDLLKTLLEKNPYLKGKDQNIFASGTSQMTYADLGGTDTGYIEVSRSFDDKFKTPVDARAPANAGVAGIPLTVIALGDGHMIQLILTDKDAPTGGLPVFDGFHMKLSSIQEDAKVINKAARAVWFNNPMQLALEAYEEFLKHHNPLESDFEELAKAMLGPQVVLDRDTFRLMSSRSKDAYEIEHEEVYASVRSVLDGLKFAAKSIAARHQVMSEFKMTADQMASVGIPYVSGGISLEGKTSAEIRDAFNARYWEIMGGAPEVNPQDRPETYTEAVIRRRADARKANPRTAGVAVDADPAVLKWFGKNKNGVQVYSQNALRKLIANGGMSEKQRLVFREILKTFIAKDYQILAGSPEDVSRHLGGTEQEIADRVRLWGNARGHMNPTGKYVAVFTTQKGASETLLHEIIHAATFEKVLAYYQGGMTDPVERAAIERIEQLMEQFNTIDVGRWHKSIQQIHPQIVKIIRGFQAKGDPMSKAHALNEFMAYTLANQKLIALTSQTRISPLVKIVKEALQLIKQVIFGKATLPKVGEDMFSNLLFNTAIVLRSQPTVREFLAETNLNQSSEFGQDSRLVEIEKVLTEKVERHLARKISASPARQTLDTKARANEITKAFDQAKEVAKFFVSKGFSLTPQAMSTFSTIVGAMTTAIQLDAVVLGRIEEYYTHVTKNLTVEDLMSDPNSTNPNVRNAAQMKFNALLGIYGVKTDAYDRSSLLPSFMALAVTSDQFREALKKVPAIKNDKTPGTTFDEKAENITAQALEAMSRTLTGERAEHANTLLAMDTLVNTLVETARDKQSTFERVTKPVGGYISLGNQKMVDWLTALSNKGMEVGQKLGGSDSNVVAKLGRMTELTAALLNEENADQVSETTIKGMNTMTRMPIAIREIIADIIGRTKSNAQVYDMIKLVRGAVQKARQQYRERLPEMIQEKFTRELTDKEWTSLFRMAEADLAVWKTNGLTHAQTMELLRDPAKLDAKKAELLAIIKKEDQQDWDLIDEKSKQLAKWMMHKKAGNNLLRNARAIAHLINEETINENRGNPSKTLINAIDQLTTAYAIDLMDQSDRDALASLAQEQEAGTSFALAYMEGRRVDELKKATGMAAMNHFKGYIPSEATEAGSLVIQSTDPKNHAKLLEQSYQFIGPYEGSNLDRRAGINLGYYYLPVASRAGFEQGIIQNVRPTAGGVDLSTGFTVSEVTAGRITDKVRVRSLVQQLSNEKDGNETLMPLFNESLEVVAFERSVDPAQVTRLNNSTHLGKMLGVWKGRQVEEAFANEMNFQLIDKLKTMYDEDVQLGRKDEYVNLMAGSRDPIIADALKLMTYSTASYAAEAFGSRRQFWVRKDMLNQVIGYRAASVGDMWTGTSRWSPQTQEAVRKLAIGVFGNEAYRKLITAESVLKNVVTDAKLIIVVKSMVVPMANFSANVLQMMARGVPIADIVRGVPRKVAEIDRYVKSSQRLMDAEAELGAVENDPVASRKLKIEIQSINDMHRSLSIWPLIKAGEFNSISDVSISREEIKLSEGRLHDYMEALVDKLPDSAKTMARYSIISRDTALFKGLQRSVEYGDFIAKAISYDHRMQRLGKTSEEALGLITEEFVNYDYLPGRTRGSLENFGLLWFWHFKLRSIKVGVSIMRNNPLHALLSQLVPVDPGSPMEDNGLSIILRGDAEWSIGPGMGVTSPLLLPTVSVIA